MKLVYNPPAKISEKQSASGGSRIKGWMFQGIEYEVHEPGKIVQYEDLAAEEIVKTFGFLEIITSAQAKHITRKDVKKEFACKLCDFSSDKNIGLVGHMRKHEGEKRADEPVVDPSIAPVAKGEKRNRRPTVTEARNASKPGHSLPEGVGTDSKGFYGKGVTERRGMGVVNPVGKGHFGANIKE